MVNTLLKGKKAVIFDLDGTLVDSMWMWKKIDIEFLGRFGYECPPDLSKSVEGMGFTETACYFKKRFKLPCSVEEIKDEWTKMSAEKYRTQVPLKKGADLFLQYIKEDFSLGIATSNARNLAELVLKELHIQSYFDTITTSCEVSFGKPAPDVYLKTAEKLKVSPERCLVFEDVPAGIRAGKAAGMTVVAVDDPFSREMRAEKQELADYFIEDYRALFP